LFSNNSYVANCRQKQHFEIKEKEKKREKRKKGKKAIWCQNENSVILLVLKSQKI
jgi:hypothetical protein